MNAKRKKVQDFIVKYIDKIARGGDNKKLYEDLFDSMSDKEFDSFMHGLKDGKITLSVIVPHDDSVKVDVENNYKIGKELGYEFFQRLRMQDEDTKEWYLTPNKYLVYSLPVKRTAQLLMKGISVPKNTKSVDLLTGQVTNGSRSAKLTMPEIQMLSGMGLKHSILELVKYRGGDTGAKNAMVAYLYKTGKVKAEDLQDYATGVESTKTLKNYFLGCHIKPEGLDG